MYTHYEMHEEGHKHHEKHKEGHKKNHKAHSKAPKHNMALKAKIASAHHKSKGK